jgi:hypothetical protein
MISIVTHGVQVHASPRAFAERRQRHRVGGTRRRVRDSDQP